MSLRTSDRRSVRSSYPVATELAFAVAAVAALSLWRAVARDVVVPALGFGPGGSGFDAVGGLLAGGVVTGTLLLAGMAAVVGAYAAVRDVEVGLGVPSSERLPVVAGAALVPVALVAATKLVGALTGTAYGTLLLTSYGPAATVRQVAPLAALGLFVGVPSLVFVCQVLVQGSFRRVVGRHAAVGLTVLVAGFLLVDASGGLNTVPDTGKVVGGGLFVLAMAVAVYGIERVERRRLRYLTFLPVAMFVVVTGLSAVAAVETVAAATFVLAQVLVLAVAAYGYERTDSLLVPALAYGSYLLAGQVVVFAFEAGV